MERQEKKVSLSEARDHFSRLVREIVRTQSSVVIALNGRPVVRCLPVAEILKACAKRGAR